MTGPTLRLLAAATLAVHPFTLAEAGHYPDPPEVPPGLEAPEGRHVFLTLHARGTQNYLCLAAGQAWTFIGPQATLFDEDDEQKVTHYLSPNPDENGEARATWQHSRDTSAVWARAIASSTDPAFVKPGAVAWLLLEVVGREPGATGGRKLSQAKFIQRVNTEGGSAPAGACPAPGARAFVPYETEYVFYK
jgi:hypothetical protein